MQKAHVYLFIIFIALIIWGIHNYDVNSSCYEITDVGAPLNQKVLLDKCKGRTWTLVEGEVEVSGYDELGNEQLEKIDSLVWTRITRSSGLLTYGDTEE